MSKQGKTEHGEQRLRGRRIVSGQTIQSLAEGNARGWQFSLSPLSGFGRGRWILVCILLCLSRLVLAMLTKADGWGLWIGCRHRLCRMQLQLFEVSLFEWLSPGAVRQDASPLSPHPPLTHHQTRALPCGRYWERAPAERGFWPTHPMGRGTSWTGLHEDGASGILPKTTRHSTRIWVHTRSPLGRGVYSIPEPVAGLGQGEMVPYSPCPYLMAIRGGEGGGRPIFLRTRCVAPNFIS